MRWPQRRQTNGCTFHLDRPLSHPEYVWYVLAAHYVLAIVVLNVSMKVWGEFREQEA